jgi:hypothetical protein
MAHPAQFGTKDFRAAFSLSMEWRACWFIRNLAAINSSLSGFSFLLREWRVVFGAPSNII